MNDKARTFAESYASECLHSWGLKGYPNLVDELKAALEFAFEQGRSPAVRGAEPDTTSTHRCDNVTIKGFEWNGPAGVLRGDRSAEVQRIYDLYSNDQHAYSWGRMQIGALLSYITSLEASAQGWRAMDSAPLDGEVVNVVARYPDATAGFPNYAAYHEGKWVVFSKNAPQEVIPWTWRPRGGWPPPPVEKEV